MSAEQDLRKKFKALNDTANKLEDALLVVTQDERPRTRGRLTAVNNEILKVKARLTTIGATTPSLGAAETAELMAAIAAVGAAVGTSAGLNGLLAAATKLIAAYKA